MFKALTASMNKLLKKIGAMFAAAAVLLSACNDSDDTSVIVDPVDYTSTAISGFSLKANKAVLNNLDSVFFAIDLNAGRVFNADSLPYGTDVSALSVSITTEGNAVMAYSPSADGTEVSEIDLVADASAKLNFSRGPVKISVTSYDGQSTRVYEVKVNVHNVVPDSLFWSKVALTTLPTTFATPVAQKAVRMGDRAYCLTTDGSAYAMAVSSDLYENSWQTASVSFPSAVETESLTATSDALYVLASDGSLLKSADGAAWSDTGEKWNAIIAPYGSGLLGVATDGADNVFVSFPAGATSKVPAEFPLRDYSDAIPFATKWSDSDQVMIFGGRKADGGCTGATWAYDGTSWAKLAESLPAAAGYAVTACTICETDTVSWRLKESSVLLAFGGVKQDGTINNTVYLSRDMGMTWKKGDSYLQLPKYMPAVSGADILVFDTVLEVGSDSDDRSARSGRGAWTELPVKPLPSIYIPGFRGGSRVAQLTTVWDCPFLYMFGGVEQDGSLQNALWRGVVNHFTFQPLY